MSLVFAGLIVDLYPGFTGRQLARPRSIRPIFWMMVLGALGLVLGPWTKSNWFSVPGVALHLSATIWLLLNMITPLIGERRAWTPGLLHLVTSYTWIVTPVLMAPLIIFGVPGFPSAGIEQSAPQALIYGWVLQFGFAIVPYMFRRAFLPDGPARLGGTWLSLIAAHLGGIFLWASIFISAYQAPLHATAYTLWALSALVIVAELWRIVHAGVERIDAERPFALADDMASNVPQVAPAQRCGKKVRLKPTKMIMAEMPPQTSLYIRPVIFGHQ
jgi:hypothetical protein